jgi:hypothetical protein
MNDEVRFLQWLETYNKSLLTGEKQEETFQFFIECGSDPVPFLTWVKALCDFNEHLNKIDDPIKNNRIKE